MFNLIRRISSSVIPRPDRPWRDDATSNAPQIGRKRRLSTADRDPEQHSTLKKIRARDWGVAESADDITSGRGESPAQQKETEEVKDVTKGVKEVVLENSSAPEASSSSSTDAPPTPPPESQVEKEPLEDEDRASERSTPAATQPPEQASDTVIEVVEKDSSVPEADAMTSALIAERLNAASSVETSTSVDVHPDGVTDAEEVEAPTTTTSAAAIGEDEGKS